MERLSFRRRFKYQDIESGIELDVDLEANGRPIQCPAKIDTGADLTIFQRELGEGLGLDIETGEQKVIGTIRGERFFVYGHNIHVRVLECDFDFSVYFTRDYDHPRNVLGRDWLSGARLAIIHYDRTLFLSHFDDDNEES